MPRSPSTWSDQAPSTVRAPFQTSLATPRGASPYASAMTPDELVSKACPVIGDMGWAYYFVPETVAKGESLGLDVVQFYFLGRGGVLGDVESAVVASAFGYFNPSLVDEMWRSAKAKLAPREAARAHFECCADLGRARLAEVDHLEEFCAAAGAVNDAADPVALALYSGFRAEPLVDDAAGRAMQLVAVLRELRGSAHLVAVRAAGLDAKTAHFIRRPNDVGLFGWTEEDAPVMGTSEHEALAAADAMTDALVLPAYSVLEPAGRDALVAGLEAIRAALTP